MKDEIKEKFKEKHKKEIEEINNQFEELIKDDEIKEILECIKNTTRDYVGINGCLYQDLKREELNLLLDYIATLQEENKKIRKMNKAKHKYAMNMEDKYITEKAKNQKAIEYGKNCLENIKDQDQYMCESIDIVSLLQMIHQNYLDILKGDNKQ